MRVYLHKDFKKQYKKLSQKIQKQFKDRKNIFLKNPFDPILHNHPLEGKWSGFRSINVTGDYRLIYRELSPIIVVFVAIDTHSNLYG